MIARCSHKFQVLEPGTKRLLTKGSWRRHRDCFSKFGSPRCWQPDLLQAITLAQTQLSKHVVPTCTLSSTKTYSTSGYNRYSNPHSAYELYEVCPRQDSCPLQGVLLYSPSPRPSVLWLAHASRHWISVELSFSLFTPDHEVGWHHGEAAFARSRDRTILLQGSRLYFRDWPPVGHDSISIIMVI